jgi:isoleucyl-tRNA synthetase
LDCVLTPELIRGGYAREVVNRLQRARKEQGFEVSDRIEVVYAAGGDLKLSISEHRDYIMAETLCVSLSEESGVAQRPGAVIAEIDGMQFAFTLRKANG